MLGLSKYRYKATEDQIKRAHRKKVLKHHPDKKIAKLAWKSAYKAASRQAARRQDPTRPG